MGFDFPGSGDFFVPIWRIYIRFGSKNTFRTSHPLHARCKTYALALRFLVFWRARGGDIAEQSAISHYNSYCFGADPHGVDSAPKTVGIIMPNCILSAMSRDVASAGPPNHQENIGLEHRFCTPHAKDAKCGTYFCFQIVYIYTPNVHK